MGPTSRVGVSLTFKIVILLRVTMPLLYRYLVVSRVGQETIDIIKQSSSFTSRCASDFEISPDD
jgi:hypothetical protein